MDFPDFLSAQRPEGLSAGQRARAIALAREAQQDAREKRLAEAEAARAAEYRQRVALTAAQLGIDGGEITRAAMAAGNAQAEVDDLRARLEKAESKLAGARQNMLEINRMMDAAMQAAGEPAVRSLGLGPGGGLGDLVQDSAGNLSHVPAPGGWMGG